MGYQFKLGVTAVACTFALSCQDSSTTDAPVSSTVQAPVAKQALELLDAVPAETPYAIASLVPAPLKELLPWARAFEAATPGAVEFLEGRLADETTKPRRKLAAALFLELRGHATEEGLAELGFSSAPRGVVYGVGVLPVATFEIADADKVDAFLRRVEERAGVTRTDRTAGEKSYFTYDVGRRDRVFFVALQGELLHVGVTPVRALDAYAEKVLEPDVADSLPEEAFEAIAAEHSIQRFSVGFVDFERIAQALLDPQPGVNEEILALLRPDAPPVVSETCKTETLALVARVPRVVFGADGWSPERWSMTAVVETKEPLIAELAAAKTGTPLASSSRFDTALAALGIGFRVGDVATAVRTRAAAVSEDPFQCEWYAGLNRAAERIGSRLTIPPPQLRDVDGGVVLVDDFVTKKQAAANDVEPFAEGLVAFSTPKSQDLYDFGRQFAPDLPTLDEGSMARQTALKADDKLRKFNDPTVGLYPNAVVFASGPVDPDALARDLEESAGSPFLTFTYDHAGIGSRIRPQSRLAEARDALRLRSQVAVEPLPTNQVHIQITTTRPAVDE